MTREPSPAALEKARALLTAKCIHDGGPACRCVQCAGMALEDFAAQAVKEHRCSNLCFKDIEGNWLHVR